MPQSEQFLDLPLEEVIGDRFGRYSKYIIQDRALPDARDGLKPVQRRILYAMHKEGNTHEKGFRKSAKTVGTVIGNYHPHGDSSVYEAMTRLSQDWKVRNVLVEMHGNNGSVDGDPPAAMRYTEARLAPIAAELLRDIDKETVDFIPNFDDTNSEPVVLPARFPNLLVNGSTGISAGYATDIPPHNLNEVIDAVIKKIETPDITVDELIKIIPGPDFPTGGILQGEDGIKQAYRTGKGKVVVRGRCSIEKLRSKREQIVITEIPYEVNKANLVKRMDELKLDRKVEGVAEIRDETDRTGMQIVIELKKDADSEGILNYFYKNTDLQVTYNFNMVAIVDKTPKLMSLIDMLDAYIKHQRYVIRRSADYDLKKAKTRHHIVEGLIKAISVLDELIQKIRESNDKKDAKQRIKSAYGFTEEQAEAIVNLQLYRLTNTDITALQQELDELTNEMMRLEKILTDKQTLDNVIKKDLKDLKKRFNTPRLTIIEKEVEELKINLEVMIASEDVLVSATRDGYIKRTSLRSYQASNGEGLAIKEDDHLVGLFEVNTTDKMLMFTNRGKYIYAPVHTLPDIRWKDLAQHASHLVGLDQGEKIIEAMPIRDFNTADYLIFFTKNGMVKRSELKQYEATRFSKPLIATGLKKGDEVISVCRSNGLQDVFIASNRGYGLRYNEAEISPVGQRAAGVKAIQLKPDEYVVSGLVLRGETDDTFFTLITQRGAMKRMALSLFEQSKRANRGQIMLRELKGKPHRVAGFLEVAPLEHIVLETTSGDRSVHHPMALSISDRYSNGSFVLDTDQVGDVVTVYKETIYQAPFKEDKA
ncbi:DNA topoisomerase 4 subunit A [Halolactibacillus alkaliphilus]|uniref:DNA topoisomerase 4 subunit A n=1 Tax=Halolactibacillus alkaliphilus TaxID=442899 RepID=A0A511WZY5_9BACI|nr:DNA topoisomerase IV subunit A [Halolactibacillus alkaliphilus]GEN56255.1 DNA topoisomerase 4 subunit A [Halolactibacillus alkaliphilus]GGN66327.1 DNA topoisomerase 4 subunit A [Halolactibacillus alkaliphilus]SFO67503.1 DNA topoisomerase IV subunit A [Halolactibacillus alkaliphilus]